MSVPTEKGLFSDPPAFLRAGEERGMRLDAVREGAERERRVLAQTLHDTLCQSLSGIRLIATLAERKAAQGSPELAGDLSELRRMVATVCDEVHQLVKELNTPPS